MKMMRYKLLGKDFCMEFVHRLPFILGAVMSVIVGIVSFAINTDISDIYIRMAIIMVVFFVLGLYAKNIIEKITSEIQEKKAEQELKELEEQARIEEERIKAEQEAKKHVVDVAVGEDYGEDFSPLTVSEYINRKDT
jgi:flagellar biosynthesis/type III secretory pathway M-ring protein FliF/YscJ